MLRIRLARRGKKRQPSYRVVVAERSSKRDGRFVEQIGYYNPMVDPIVFKVEEGRALHWLSVGAQPSDAVRRLLEKQGTYDRLTRLHAGEEIDKLVAEYEGTPWPPVEDSDESDESGESNEGIVANVQERVSNAAESVSERVGGAVDTVSGAVDSVRTAAAGVAQAVANAAGQAADAIDGDDDEAEATEEESSASAETEDDSTES